jgi:hypothetical protein
LDGRQAFSFHLRGWAARVPGMPPFGAEPPMLLRRRVSPLGREALRTAWALPEAQNSRVIVSSRHGEFGRTLSLLETMAAGVEVSPADFTLSVHHALAGLLSIACTNRQGHTAIAAGPESFCFGLLEAVATLAGKPADPVVLLHYDEALPEPFARFDDTPAPFEVLALVLAAEGEGFSLAITPADGEKAAATSAAAEFIAFLRDGDAAEGVFRGERCKWHWRRQTGTA